MPGRTGIFSTALMTTIERDYFQLQYCRLSDKGKKKIWKFTLFILLLVNKAIETETSYFVIYRKICFSQANSKGNALSRLIYFILCREDVSKGGLVPPRESIYFILMLQEWEKNWIMNYFGKNGGDVLLNCKEISFQA